MATVLRGQLRPQMEYFVQHACIPPEHESAVKRAIWNLTLGLAHVRGGGVESTLTFQLKTKLQIWQYFDIAKQVALAVEIATPPTSEYSDLTAVNMLAGEKVWVTKVVPTHQAESVVLVVAAGSRVTSFDVASYRSTSKKQMCVEEVAADGTVGATLVAWKHYGTYSGSGFKPRYCTPATIAVQTTATRFKVSVRQKTTYLALAGLAIFRATGAAPPS